MKVTIKKRYVVAIEEVDELMCIVTTAKTYCALKHSVRFEKGKIIIDDAYSVDQDNIRKS